jgi:hypothetical protein
VDRIQALHSSESDTDTGALPPPVLHRTLAYALGADRGQHLRTAAAALQQKVLRDLDAGERSIPLTLLPLLGEPSIHTPGAFRNFIMGDAASKNGGGDIVSRLASSAGPSMVVEELGYGCTATKDYFKEVIALLPAIDERELARLIAVLARTHSCLDVGSCGQTLQSLTAAVGIAPPSPAALSAATWNYNNAVDALLEVWPSQ